MPRSGLDFAEFRECKRALKQVEWASTTVQQAELRLRERVRSARKVGATWQDIADALGLSSRQVAHERYGRERP